MRFVPSGSTQIGATPLAPGARETNVTSIPCSWKFVRVVSPNTSSPRVFTIETVAPKRLAITAWLAPLPPKPNANESPITVSPACGTFFA